MFMLLNFYVNVKLLLKKPINFFDEDIKDYLMSWKMLPLYWLNKADHRILWSHFYLPYISMYLCTYSHTHTYIYSWTKTWTSNPAGQSSLFLWYRMKWIFLFFIWIFQNFTVRLACLLLSCYFCKITRNYKNNKK